MTHTRIFMIPLLAFSLNACQASNQEVGTLLGAIGGAVIGDAAGGKGSNVLAIAVGALAGAWLGGELGKSLDRADRAYMRNSTQYALESSRSGDTSQWVNPDSGHQGTVTPNPAYQDNAGRHCREFQQTVTIGGKTEEAYGTACRMPDGSWKIISTGGS